MWLALTGAPIACAFSSSTRAGRKNNQENFKKKSDNLSKLDSIGAKMIVGRYNKIDRGRHGSNDTTIAGPLLARVNHDFVAFCCMQLNKAGIPADKIYTHIAAAAGYAGSVFLQFSNAPLATAFNPYATPGFTTYITGDPDDLTLIYSALAQQKVSHWGSTEANPALTGGVSPAEYLQMHFDHGATVMVLNIGATSVDLSNQLYAGVYGSDALAAYYSFLSNQ